MSSNELPIKLADLSPEYAEIMVLGRVFKLSGYFADIRDEAQAVTKILFGRELGFSPIVSMGGIHIIEGKPALSSNLMATLIKRSGKYDYRISKWDSNQCIIEFKEKTAQGWIVVGESSFTIEDAKTAGIKFTTDRGNPTSWKKYPKAMLFARALSQGLRAYCPDVSAAPVYNPEEMGATVNEEGNVTELPRSARPVPVTTEDIVIGEPMEATVKRESFAKHLQQIGGEGEGTAQREGDVSASNEIDAETIAIGKEWAEQVSDLDFRPGPPRPHSKRTLAPITEAEAAVKKALIDAQANLSLKPATLPADAIETGQAVNFERTFKDALTPHLRKHAEEIAHDWLLRQGIVDGNGIPTAKAILKQNYYECREAAVEYAASLDVWK